MNKIYTSRMLGKCQEADLTGSTCVLISPGGYVTVIFFQVLHETALVETFNLKAAIEYQLKNCEYIVYMYSGQDTCSHAGLWTSLVHCFNYCEHKPETQYAVAKVVTTISSVICDTFSLSVYCLLLQDEAAQEAITDMPPRSEEVRMFYCSPRDL